VQPGAVRAIEYEIVLKSEAASFGLSGAPLVNELQVMPELGVLRCVHHHGRKLTVIGDAWHVRELLANGQASDPDGMTLKTQSFPIVVSGWLNSH
jgi:hypothetical protein